MLAIYIDTPINVKQLACIIVGITTNITNGLNFMLDI